jgi:hypothetical protein
LGIYLREFFFFTKEENLTEIVTEVKVKQSRYRPGVAQRVPGS